MAQGARGLPLSPCPLPRQQALGLLVHPGRTGREGGREKRERDRDKERESARERDKDSVRWANKRRPPGQRNYVFQPCLLTPSMPGISTAYLGSIFSLSPFLTNRTRSPLKTQYAVLAQRRSTRVPTNTALIYSNSNGYRLGFTVQCVQPCVLLQCVVTARNRRLTI